MYEHIIVPFDGTDHAQRTALLAADVATTMGAKLVLATASDLSNDKLTQALKARAMHDSDDTVTVWLEPAHSQAQAIATMAAYRPNSLVCMYTHARAGLLRTVYGSLAEKVLRSVDAPVLLTGPRWHGSSVVNLKHLILCTDGSPTAEAAVPLVAEWASVLPLNITLVHVQSEPDEDPVDLDPIVASLEGRCEIIDEITVQDRDIVQGILGVLQHSINPFVVMATHARTGLERLVFGSIVAEVTARSPVPVLVQRGPLPTVHFPPAD